MNQKKIAIAGISAAMLVGAGTGFALGLPTGAGASGSSVSVTDPTDPTATAGTTSSDDSTTTGDAARPGPRAFLTDALADLVTAGTITQEQSDAIIAGIEAAASGGERGQRLSTALADLVTAGTLTQEQSDAVTAAIEALRPEGGPGGMGGHGGPGHGGMGHGGRGFGGGQLFETAATALGITADELKTELDAGKSIADVAGEKGVDVQTVIDAIVAEQTADITQRVTDMVNGVRPDKAADAPAGTESTDDTTATTDGS